MLTQLWNQLQDVIDTIDSGPAHPTSPLHLELQQLRLKATAAQMQIELDRDMAEIEAEMANKRAAIAERQS